MDPQNAACSKSVLSKKNADYATTFPTPEALAFRVSGSYLGSKSITMRSSNNLEP